jgi:hypothetical protein
MCPACLAALAMMVAGTGSTGGVAAVLIHKFRVQKGKPQPGMVRQIVTRTEEDVIDFKL